MAEVMTRASLQEAASGMQAKRDVRLKPTIRPVNDGMGLFEASQAGNKVARAQSAARLMKKAGASADDAKDRLQKKYGLSTNELRSVLGSIWGKTEGADLSEAKPKVFTRQEAHDYLTKKKGFKAVSGSSRYNKAGATGRIENASDKGDTFFVSIDGERVTEESFAKDGKTPVPGLSEESDVYAALVKNKDHLPKKISARIVKVLKSGIGKGTKVTITKSKSTSVRGWDWGNYTVVHITLPDGESLDGALQFNFAKDGEASAHAALDAKYGGVVSTQRGTHEQVIERTIRDVANHLKK